LAASVAHEINNPLTYILGNLDFVREGLEQMDKVISSLREPARGLLSGHMAHVRKALDPVRSGTERIATITRELRTFSGPAAEETSLVNVRSTVESVLMLMRKELEARARLQIDLQKTTMVMGNSARLVQVVMNLAANAMQAVTKDQKEIGEIWISTRTEGAWVVVEIADNGPGVPEDDRERIFEPFVTTKDMGEGTGLGLFVCRNIVRAFSGKLTVNDRPGGGAVFRVDLPVAPASGQSNSATSRRSSGIKKPARGHVLIIEDELLVAEALSRPLLSAGYRVSMELDPVTALESLSTDGHGIDLVYCDLMMKKMSGMELAEALESRAPAQFRKLVFMTGGAFTPVARAFRERYATQCVEKPFDILSDTSRRLNFLLRR
jgi:CheY-like chemotaxis protein/anti-sigma regulatory factor (Ser/Thr protein kinase)